MVDIGEREAMNTRRTVGAERDKRRALRQAAVTAEEWRSSTAARDEAVRSARAAGASVAEIVEATGLAPNTVARVVGASDSDAPT